MSRATTAERPMPRKEPATTFTCGTCLTTYGEAAWRLLRVAERIEAPHVRSLVSRWPDGVFINVRHCKECGRPIAAKRARQ